MLDCIVNEVCKHLREQLAIATKVLLWRNIAADDLAFGLGGGTEGVGHVLKNIAQIHRFESSATGSGFDLRNAQEGRKRSEDVVGFGDHGLDHSMLILT